MKLIQGGGQPWEPCKRLGKGTWVEAYIRGVDQNSKAEALYPVLAFVPDGPIPEHFEGRDFHFAMNCVCPPGSPRPKDMPTTWPPETDPK